MSPEIEAKFRLILGKIKARQIADCELAKSVGGIPYQGALGETVEPPTGYHLDPSTEHWIPNGVVLFRPYLYR